ncbi:MAG: hypothetical protein ACI9EF_003621 [Pseudohongiellaceae bacterium]|jgi:hypothetical protein
MSAYLSQRERQTTLRMVKPPKSPLYSGSERADIKGSSPQSRAVRRVAVVDPGLPLGLTS